jgi:hypothetical protein
MDILLSFAGLNNRLNRTISDFIHQIDLTSIISYENYLYLLRTTFPSIWLGIQSLTISNCQIPCLTKLFLETSGNSLPPNLKKLSLFHLNTKEMFSFITRLMKNCAVEELIIDCSDAEFVKQQEFYGYKIAQMLFYHHPTLKSIELRGDIIFGLSHLSFLSLSNSDDANVSKVVHILKLEWSKLLLIHPPIKSIGSFSVTFSNPTPIVISKYEIAAFNYS